MKILVINGSARKGNTWKLVNVAKQTIMNHDSSVVIDEIQLIHENLPFCIGCSNCFRAGHEKCPHFKIVGEIIRKMDEADGIIIASTTYNMRETALLINLFDHLCFMLHRPHFFKSKAFIITTTGGVGGRSAAKRIASMLRGIGFNRCYMFSKASFSWNSYEPNEKTKNSLAKKVMSFYKDVSSHKLYGPKTKLLIPYNLFRGMSLAYTPGSEYETMDGIFWTSKDRASKVYDASVKVPFYKKPIGHIFYSIGKLAGKMKSMQITYRK